MANNKKVSCVIRTFNEAEFIGKCLDTLLAQDGEFDLEVVVVDSGSTDATLSILKEYKIKLIEIEHKNMRDFDYSYALNCGIEACSGEFVIILSAHSIAMQKKWITKMISHFDQERVAGVYCRQVAWPDADWSESLRIQKTFTENSRGFTKKDISDLHTYSNVASCMRRDVWRKYPFLLPAAEDIDWARRVLEKGYKIVYEAGVSVYHSHKESARKKAERSISLAKSTDMRLGIHRSLLLTIRQAAGGVLRDINSISSLGTRRTKKINYYFGAIAKACWFVVEFNHTGTGEVSA